MSYPTTKKLSRLRNDPEDNYKFMALIKNPTIKDFEIIQYPAYIKWEEIERVLGKRRYKKFSKWMRGQTCVEDGAYPCDVENFLRKPEYRFFD